MVIYKIKYLLKRIYWRLFPKSNSECLAIIESYIKTGKYPNIKNIDQTIDTLLQSNASIARYGDGEFTLCLGRSIGFQHADKHLQRRLREILKSNRDNCLIGLPECTLTNISDFWVRYWYENFYNIIQLLNPGKQYYNQSITREFNLEQIQKLKELWKGRNVIFVFGEGSRFNHKHELFSDIASSKIVLGPARNAWSKYSEIFEHTIKIAKNIANPLILISLGPTATVLAYSLSMEGIRSIDIGHITNMYDKLLYGTAKPEDLPIIKQ